MSKGKKIYCIASFAFACAVLILTITLCMMHPGRVYASSMDPDSITKITQKDTQGADHNTDNANGLSITYNNDSGSVSTPIKMLLVLTILSLAPSILIMMTSFTRIIIVLHFLRTAIGTQTTPPNQVLIGLALFLTFFIMWPTFQQINKEAIQPLDKGEITQSEFFEKAEDVCFRDKYSYNLFSDIKAVRYAPDIIFTLDTKNLEKVQNTKRAIFSIISCRDKVNVKYEEEYKNAIIDMTKKLIDDGYKITYMSFCKNENDELAIEEILEKIDNNIICKHFA